MNVKINKKELSELVKKTVERYNEKSKKDKLTFDQKLIDSFFKKVNSLNRNMN